MFIDGFGGEITRGERQLCLMIDGCQAEFKDGVVFRFVRQPGERTQMAGLVIVSHTTEVGAWIWMVLLTILLFADDE